MTEAVLPRGVASAATPVQPLTVDVDVFACMLNFELADDPVYDSAELQWFDDEVHGRGMLVMLSRRTDRRVDYYAQRGLTLDRAGYHIGGGTGTWTDLDLDDARLEVADDGVVADVRFTDVDDREVEIRIDDRNDRPRRRGGLLAPVSAAIDEPKGLLLVWMPAFDLVRVTGTAPVLRFGGRDATVGRLPGARLHRRHLIKYAAPVIAVQVNRTPDGPTPVSLAEPPSAITGRLCGHRALLRLEPALPELETLPVGERAAGRWVVEVDGVRLTSGTWAASRGRDKVDLCLDVAEGWRPGRLPWLMRLVTTVAPVFRRWPTTYRWRAQVEVGPPPVMSARWERTTSDRARRYRQVTRS